MASPYQRRRHVLVVSDSTGKAGRMLVEATLAQFQDTQVDLEILSHVNTPEQITEIVRRASILDGIVIYTLVSGELRNFVLEEGMNHGVPTVDILGPLLTRLTDLLQTSPLAQPGLYRRLDSQYFRRIEAMEYTVKHDDGAGLSSMNKAEIILVGVSRASKTPLSIYLSYRGWWVANVPIVSGIPLPKELIQADPKKIIGLTVNPGTLRMIRLERERHLGVVNLEGYTDTRDIQKEVIYALRFFREHNWPVIETTNKSIEESATEIMKLLSSRTGK